jgi:hypothetical protein
LQQHAQAGAIVVAAEIVAAEFGRHRLVRAVEGGLEPVGWIAAVVYQSMSIMPLSGGPPATASVSPVM